MFSSRNRRPAGSPATPAVPLTGPQGAERVTVAAGCFWGVEAAFRELPGVLQTAVGYTGGYVPFPTYRQVCGHRTGHAEAVDVWFDPARHTYAQILDTFWRIHNPTTRHHQGWSFGSQYRSAIFVHNARQQAAAIASRDAAQRTLARPIVTQITQASAFYPAEEYHQRYLEKKGRASCTAALRE
jgi:peptide-methionine (S)-S-oxide reductase